MLLQDIKEEDFDNIYYLTKVKKTMQYVGNGRTWYEKKVKKFIQYNLEEQEMEDRYRTQFYYKIMINNTFGGIIGFHIQGTRKYVLTIILSRDIRGKGYFKEIIELLKKKIKKHKPHVKNLYVQVYPENERMNEIMDKNYRYVGEFKLGRNNLNEYMISLYD